MPARQLVRETAIDESIARSAARVLQMGSPLCLRACWEDSDHFQSFPTTDCSHVTVRHLLLPAFSLQST
eukprot:2786386-Amphidinium_carterae.1